MSAAVNRGLGVLVDRLLDAVSLVQGVLDQATGALLEADLEFAESAIAGTADVEVFLRALDDRAQRLLTCPQPRPADLLAIVAGLEISGDLRRMAKFAQHIAEVAHARYPRPAVPVELRPAIRLMSQAARHIALRAREAIATADADAAARLDRADDEIDRLHHALYLHLFDGTWHHGADTAVDVALVGRYYERYADHATALAHRVALLTGTRDRAPHTTSA